MCVYPISDWRLMNGEYGWLNVFRWQWSTWRSGVYCQSLGQTHNMPQPLGLRKSMMCCASFGESRRAGADEAIVTYCFVSRCSARCVPCPHPIWSTEIQLNPLQFQTEYLIRRLDLPIHMLDLNIFAATLTLARHEIVEGLLILEKLCRWTFEMYVYAWSSWSMLK